LKSKARSWEELIKTQVQSGQTIRVFCEGRQIKKYAFYYWKKRLSGCRGRFIPIPRAIHLVGKSPRIHLPNGVQIELGAGLESGVVTHFLRGLCGVNHPPKDACPPAIGRGRSAKP
jgi:hypothetical protein